MRARLLVVQHEPTSTPGLLAAAARNTGVTLEVVEAPDQPVPVALGDADGLVVLGGEMDADEIEAYPHLEQAMALVRDTAARERPTLGICLGAQLAAEALGGRAYPGPAGEELGWTKLELTDAGRADPVLGGLGEPAEVFEWHHDTFDPPPGATQLARGPRYEQQAFRVGSVVGVQFHPEVDAPLLAAWWAGSGDRLAYPQADAVAGAERNAAASLRLLEAFCQVTAGRCARDRRPGRGTMRPA